MKQIFKLLTFSLLLALMAGCKKDGTEKNADISSSLAGKWELRQSSGGMMPTIYNHLPGNGNILNFTESEYEVYTNGQLTKAGHYTIVSDTSVEQSVCLIFPKGQFLHRIIYDNNSSADKTFLQITNNRLTFISGCYALDSGHSDEYDRQPDENQ